MEWYLDLAAPIMAADAIISVVVRTAKKTIAAGSTSRVVFPLKLMDFSVISENCPMSRWFPLEDQPPLQLLVMS